MMDDMNNNDSVLAYSTETGSTGDFAVAPFDGVERPCDATPGCKGTIRQPSDDIYEDCDTCGYGERVDCCYECAGIDLVDEDGSAEEATSSENVEALPSIVPVTAEEKAWQSFLDSLA